MEKATAISRHMKIKLKAETGETVKVVDDSDHDAPDVDLQELDLKQLEQLCRGVGGYQCVGVVLHRHSSPG
jgi:hypothetical protein